MTWEPSLQFAHRRRLAALPLHSHHPLSLFLLPCPSNLTSLQHPFHSSRSFPHIFPASVHFSSLNRHSAFSIGFPLNRDLFQTTHKRPTAQICTIHSFHIAISFFVLKHPPGYLGSDRPSSTFRPSPVTAVSFTPTPAHRYASNIPFPVLESHTAAASWGFE